MIGEINTITYTLDTRRPNQYQHLKRHFNPQYSTRIIDKTSLIIVIARPLEKSDLKVFAKNVAQVAVNFLDILEVKGIIKHADRTYL